MRNETTNTRRTALQAMTVLRNVQESKIEAWKVLAATDPLTASALVAAVRARCASLTGTDRDAVESVATTCAAALYAGRTDRIGADRTLAAASAAVRFAAKRVAETYALEVTLTDYLRPIVGEDGDMVAALEDAITDGRALAPLTARMPSIGEGAHETFLDRVEALIWRATRNDGGAHADGLTYAEGAELVAAVRAYADHLTGAEHCPVCEGAPTTKRPTIASVLAHVAGERTSSAAGKARMRRNARLVSALADFLPSMLDDDTNPRPSVPSAVRMVAPVTEVAPAPVTVRSKDGVTLTRPATDAERAFITAPRTGAPERLSSWEGEGEGGQDTRPALARTGGQPVPSGKVPVSPRKKSGSGSTGPTVSGRTSVSAALPRTGGGRTAAGPATWGAEAHAAVADVAYRAKVERGEDTTPTLERMRRAERTRRA